MYKKAIIELIELIYEERELKKIYQFVLYVSKKKGAAD